MTYSLTYTIDDGVYHGVILLPDGRTVAVGPYPDLSELQASADREAAASMQLLIVETRTV